MSKGVSRNILGVTSSATPIPDEIATRGLSLNCGTADTYRLDAADDWDALLRICELPLSSFQPADRQAAQTMLWFAKVRGVMHRLPWWELDGRTSAMRT